MVSDGNKSSREADHWQKKYYDSLDELDEKQREWNQLEKQLRLLVSRLTLIAETDNTQLEKQLTKLRSQVRESGDLSRLQQLFSDISGAIAALPDKNDDKSPRQSPAHSLELLLNEITIPKDLGRQEKYVRKKLAKMTDIGEVPSVVKDLVELLTMVIESGMQGSHPESQQEKAGFLSSLFRRSDEQTSQPQSPVKPGVTDLEKDISPDKKLKAPESASITDNACSLAGDILIQLLERIDLSDDLATESELIRGKLDPCNDITSLHWGLDATVNLIADLQQRIQSEKSDLENFLLQLTDRLQELDKDIQETARLRDASLNESRTMNQAVNREVNDIQKSVDEALDLDSLKTSIQSRVVIIRNHVDRFLELEEGRGGESHQIIERLKRQLEAAEQETSHLRSEVQKEQHKAETDTLTQIPNRMAYDKKLQDELARFKRYGSKFVLMVWDVDKFKNINDSYGHAAGDKVLKIMAQLMDKQLRETDFLARYGGEEFVVLLTETDIEASRIVAEKLRQAIEATEFHFRGSRVPITASCGMAQVQQDETGEQLFQRADAALYKAKENGRNRVEAD